MSNYQNETHVYVYTKKFLRDNGWILIAGEPAGGSDELPRVEIRDRLNTNKGSKGSYKIDLIGVKGDLLLLTEIKTKFNYTDIEKLNEVVSVRLQDLKDALFERLKLDVSNKKIIKSISVSNLGENTVPGDFVCLEVISDDNIRVINESLFLEN